MMRISIVALAFCCGLIAGSALQLNAARRNVPTATSDDPMSVAVAPLDDVEALEDSGDLGLTFNRDDDVDSPPHHRCWMGAILTARSRGFSPTDFDAELTQVLAQYEYDALARGDLLLAAYHGYPDLDADEARGRYINQAVEELQLAKLVVLEHLIEAQAARADLAAKTGNEENVARYCSDVFRTFDEVEEYAVTYAREEYYRVRRSCQAAYASGAWTYLGLDYENVVSLSADDEPFLYSAAFREVCERRPSLARQLYSCLGASDRREITFLEWINRRLSGERIGVDITDEEMDALRMIAALLRRSRSADADFTREMLITPEVEAAEEEMLRFFRVE